MKNNIYNTLSGFASHITSAGRVLSVIFMLALSSSAWATYYVYISTDKSTWTFVTNSETKSFTISNSNYLNSGTNYYLAVSTNSGGYSSSYKEQMYLSDVVNNSSSFITTSKDNASYSGCPFSFMKYSLPVPVSNLYLSLESESYTHNCGSVYTDKQQKYIVSVDTPTLKLCGGFTDWSTSEAPEMTETGTVGMYSTSVYLPGGHEYEKQTSEGFKVAAVTSSGSATWYGADATITSASNSQTLASTDAGGSAGNRCGITTVYSGSYTFTYNASSKLLTVTYPDAIEATPIVRCGALPTQTRNATYSSEGCDRYDINASAYIASPGCSAGSEQTLSNLRVRLRKKVAGEYTETEVVEFPGSYSRNSTYSLTVPCTTELLMTCLSETTIVMDIAGYNSVMGWSAYSDEMEVEYTACPKFILENLSKTFTACDGEHQFTLRDMVKPTPTGWSATLGGADATSDFTLKDGQMIWKGIDKDAGTYTYTFAFTRNGFNGEGKPNTATIEIEYNKTAPTGSVTGITITPSPKGTAGTPVTPWTPLTLTATLSDGNSFTDVQWSVSGVPAPVFEEGTFTSSSATATFTSKPFAVPVTYTVTARGLSGNCQSTDDEHSYTINVYADSDNGSGSTIILNGDAPVVDDGPEVTLNGYVKQLVDGNATLKKLGFAYIKSEGNSCGDVTGSWSKVEITPAEALKQGESWSASINTGLKENTEYLYRAYAVNTYPSTAVTTYSTNPNNSSEAACGTFTTQGGCEYPTGDTIYYTIDASLVSESPCHLAFKSFENALANLKSHKTAGAADYWWDNSKMMLVKNVVFQVAINKAGYGVKNSRVDFSNINKYESSSSPLPTKRLVIRPLVSGTKPIVWGMYMANSRWITVNSMNVQRVAPSTTDGKGHSCILIGLDDQTNNLAVGKVTSANLEFVNCEFSGDNFCCIHASAVDGLYLENNNLIAECGDASQDTRDWGASIKFMNCKNITLIRNNFKGAHSNNIFSQNTRDLLVMNNVFWNDNKKFDAGTNNSAIIRLVNFEANDDAHAVKNVGVYYNTLYLAKNDANSDNVDFFIFGGNDSRWNTAARYDESTIEFMYNNCYSYSTSSAGKSSNPFLSKTITSTMHHNNFWSARTGSSYGGDEFEFGANIENHSMAAGGDMLCSTAAHTPEGMIIKGTALNLGSAISTDVSGLGADTVRSDRLDFKIRPNDNTWTYGAYQSRSGETVDVIIWNGGKDATWDDRNNWVKENGRQVTCVDNLSDNLKVIIPEPHSKQYPLPASGYITKYPTVPTWATPASSEAVRAGITESTRTTVTKFAHSIEMEYGSAIKGVEELKVGDAYHYYNVQSHLTVDPKEWVLVGSVVRPFKDKDKAMAATPTLPADSATRLTQSGDFYLYHKPHVYMQKFDIAYNSGSVVATWGTPFTDLKTDVEPTETFAISVADQFGDMKLPASFYYAIFEPDPSKLNDGDKQRTFDFNGHYYAAEQALNYTVPATSLGVFNNAYPANIDGTATYSNFNLYTYDYNDKAWEAIGTIEDKMIKPQSGFAIYNTSGSSNTFSPVYVTAVADGKDIDTKYKTAEANAQVIIRAYNLFNDKGSRIGVGEAFNDAYKLFNGSVSENLEVYMLKNDGKYSTLKTDDFNTVIPVGVRNKSNSAYPIRFELIKAEGVESVILEDRGVTPAATYDLLSGEAPAFPSIEPGDLEGRFYLMLGAGTEENPDIPTDAPAESADSLNVDVFVNNGIMTVSVSADAVISNITMYDMAGKAYKVAVNGTNMNKSKLNVAKGVYTVTVVTDKGTETKKVIVK
jgi:hypothetical protein